MKKGWRKYAIGKQCALFDNKQQATSSRINEINK